MRRPPPSRWCVFNTDVGAIDAQGQTLLHVAAQGGHTSVIAALAAAGATPSAAAPRAHTVGAIQAAAAGHSLSPTALFRTGVLARARGGRTPLHVASSNGHAAAVRALVTAGAAVDAADEAGVTPLHAAVADGH